MAPGVFLILAAKAPASVWKVHRSARGVITRLEKKREHVYHYSFHIMDPAFGHLVIKMSGHPPFGAQVILNGHKYVAVAAQAASAGVIGGHVMSISLTTSSSRPRTSVMRRAVRSRGNPAACKLRAVLKILLTVQFRSPGDQAGNTHDNDWVRFRIDPSGRSHDGI